MGSLPPVLQNPVRRSYGPALVASQEKAQGVLVTKLLQTGNWVYRHPHHRDPLGLKILQQLVELDRFLRSAGGESSREEVKDHRPFAQKGGQINVALHSGDPEKRRLFILPKHASPFRTTGSAP